MSPSDDSTGEPGRGSEGPKETKSEQAPDADTETVGGLGEIVPEPLRPIWRRVESVQEFRRTHGETYVTALEAAVAAVLGGGYVYWLYLFLTG